MRLGLPPGFRRRQLTGAVTRSGDGMADIAPLKGAAPSGACGFESHPRHYNPAERPDVRPIGRPLGRSAGLLQEVRQRD